MNCGHCPEWDHTPESCYAGGCRQPGCRAATVAYKRQLREVHRRLHGARGRIDATATAAKVRWLHEEGGSWRWIGGWIGATWQVPWRLATGRQRLVTRRNAARIEQLAVAVARGDVQPPGFREARHRKIERERRRQYRETA